MADARDPISQEQAIRIALEKLGPARESAWFKRKVEVKPGSTADNLYGAFKYVTQPCHDCWIVLVCDNLGMTLDGPVDLFWVSRESGAIVAHGRGHDGG